jgi:hypothetical protein
MFVLAFSTKWRDLFVQLGERWPTKGLTAVGYGKVCHNFIWLDRCEPFDPSFLERVCRDRFVELSIMRIHSVNRLE